MKEHIVSNETNEYENNLNWSIKVKQNLEIESQCSHNNCFSQKKFYVPITNKSSHQPLTSHFITVKSTVRTRKTVSSHITKKQKNVFLIILFIIILIIIINKAFQL